MMTWLRFDAPVRVTAARRIGTGALLAALLGAAPALAQPAPAASAPAATAPAPHPAVMRPVLLTRPGMDAVRVERDRTYAPGDHRMDVYRPATDAAAPRGAVLIVPGTGPAGMRPKDWGIIQSWGRLIAASDRVAISFAHRTDGPVGLAERGRDLASALAYVRDHAAELGVDPDRVCLLAFSAGGPLLSDHLAGTTPGVRCLAGIYPLLDMRGATGPDAANGAETLARYSPAARIADASPGVPTLIVRAGKDELPGLLAGLDRFVAAALANNYPIALLNHPEGGHGFDNTLDDARTREVLNDVLAFLTGHTAP